MKKLIYSQEDLDLILSLEIQEKDEEIERLNNKIHDISETLNETYNDRTELRNENKRLNNIINGIEKWLEEQHQFIIEIPAFTREISIEHKTMEICYENVLDKLQELKGDGSNENK